MSKYKNIKYYKQRTYSSNMNTANVSEMRIGS